MKTIRLPFLIIILVGVFAFESGGEMSFQERRTIQNLRSFAKLYGYIKYFHPSDEASQIDWDKFAIYGVERVKNAQNSNELRTILTGLFLPVAPTIQIYLSDEKPAPFVAPQNHQKSKIVSWQHLGVRLGDTSNIYKSIRLNRANPVSVSPFDFGAVTQEKNLSTGNTAENFSDPLFDASPKIGEVITKALGADLMCQIPLTLYSNGALGQENNDSFNALSEQLDKLEVLTADDEFVRLANIVIAWNVFQHFYPYFDTVSTDWDADLTDLFKETLTNQNKEDFYITLRRLVAKLHDGHGRVSHKMSKEKAGFPFLVDWIENSVVITRSKDAAHFKVGDMITSVDGVPAEQMLLDEEALISGSPQWQRVNALRQFAYGKEGTTARLQIIRDGDFLDVEAIRNTKERLSEPARSRIEEIEEGIFYVNLDKVEMDEIQKRMDDLADARGVIFDLRGYPKGNHGVINHLLTHPDTSNAWMRVPQIIYPDQENVVGFTKHGWHLQPAEPHIKGRVVFLTDGRAISYAESFMSFVEHYRLAEIVGQPTAGTNGNVNRLELPGGFRITWTGMRVVKHDGSRLHLIGIQPTVPAHRTIQGVIEGRDEFVEKAIDVILKM